MNRDDYDLPLEQFLARVGEFANYRGWEKLSEPVDLAKLSVAQLVSRFIEIGVAQDWADGMDRNDLWNQFFQFGQAIEQELKSRPGDERSALMPLYNHQNEQVQLLAARATLAVAPKAAKRALAAIRDMHCGTQSIDAGSCLSSIELGIYKPT
jgi:hypothetical protein